MRDEDEEVLEGEKDDLQLFRGREEKIAGRAAC
jgi:hypothetical protein